MYCSKCGVQNSDGAAQCVNCGGVLVDTSSGQPVGETVPIAITQPQTCGLAIASLVMGILSLFCSFLLGIPAIICGIIALSRIKGAGGRLGGRGMAIAGIIIPSVLIVISIFAMFLAILMPAMGQVRGVAKRVVCATNLKGLSTAMVVYTYDYHRRDYDKLPTENWCDLLIEEADISPKFFICPDSDTIEGRVHMQ